ncbi:MAG TPA: ATP-dependent helicase, partial [Nannocystis exedens]|nr:ATP-dependent helicase [Nannocystis exedens]
VAPPEPVRDRSLAESADPRSFLVIAGDDDLLKAALGAPFERWIAFLHPSQRKLIDRAYSGPAKVSGSAGTGKTVVAMHRARHLARQGKRVLMTTFVRALCSNIKHNLGLLCSDAERKQITVSTLHSQALALARLRIPGLEPGTARRVDRILEDLLPGHAAGFALDFVKAEWQHVIVAQGLMNWPQYRTAKRSGRGKGLTMRERKTLWGLFESLRAELRASNCLDWAAICHQASEALSTDNVEAPFDAIIVDEVQDLSVPELRFVAALSASNPGDLMLCGDPGQRLYAGSFSLFRLGLNIRGRSTILRINYRTTEQIRRVADRLIGEKSDNMDGGLESRKGTRSLIRGPQPTFAGYASPKEEYAAAAEQARCWLDEGLKPGSIALFARTKRQVQALQKALKGAGLPSAMLSEDNSDRTAIGVGTMHGSKGLEFRAVLVAAVTSKLLPYSLVLSKASDPQDRGRALENERRLLYVALTRAREQARVTWHREPSPFIAPLIEPT